MNCGNLYLKCELCARRCGIDRTAGQMGYCKSSSIPHVSRAALHMWEEPIISGTSGSGTIFFSGCSLGCVFCQNRTISRGDVGVTVDVRELAEIMLSLQSEGANNINFVTPTHYVPSIIESTEIARNCGLCIPTVYNTGSYDTVDTLKLLSGTIDIYLPDFKYIREDSASKLSYARDYPSVAKAAIDEMVCQKPDVIIKNGIMRSGVIVRILLLPHHVAEAKLSVKYLYERYKNDIYISLMNQYTPMPGMTSPLDRKVTCAEYSELVSYAERIGVVNAFVQEQGTQSESFIPAFDNTISGLQK